MISLQSICELDPLFDDPVDFTSFTSHTAKEPVSWRKVSLALPRPSPPGDPRDFVSSAASSLTTGSSVAGAVDYFDSVIPFPPPIVALQKVDKEVSLEDIKEIYFDFSFLDQPHASADLPTEATKTLSDPSEGVQNVPIQAEAFDSDPNETILQAWLRQTCPDEESLLAAQKELIMFDWMSAAVPPTEVPPLLEEFDRMFKACFSRLSDSAPGVLMMPTSAADYGLRQGDEAKEPSAKRRRVTTCSSSSPSVVSNLPTISPYGTNLNVNAYPALPSTPRHSRARSLDHFIIPSASPPRHRKTPKSEPAPQRAASNPAAARAARLSERFKDGKVPSVMKKRSSSVSSVVSFSMSPSALKFLTDLINSLEPMEQLLYSSRSRQASVSSVLSSPIRKVTMPKVRSSGDERKALTPSRLAPAFPTHAKHASFVNLGHAKARSVSEFTFKRLPPVRARYAEMMQGRTQSLGKRARE